MKKTVIVAVATQALEEKGLGHKRAKECAEHVYESLASMGAVPFDASLVRHEIAASKAAEASPI